MPQTPAASLVDHVYGHCVAVLGLGEAATEAASAALRHGGRGRSSALGWARHEALARAGSSDPVGAQVPADLNELALLLSFTRPADERAVLDLEGRHELDRAQLGRALGMSPARAAARVTEVGASWAAALDPVLLAFLGPGDCEGFPDTAGTDVTVADLLAAGPAVAAHADVCELCADRSRAMVSVRGLLAHRSLEKAPPSVGGRASRLRGLASPPPAEPRSRRTALRLLAGAAVVTVVLGLIAGISVALASRSGAAGRKERVRALTKVASANALEIIPSVLDPSSGNAVLDNTSAHAVTWTVAIPVDWLLVAPASGRLDPGQTAHLTATLLPTAPVGQQGVTLTVTGDDGSATALRIETVVDRPPQVGATREGCTVTATVEDDDSIGSVTLHWTDPSGEQSIDLLKTSTGYTAALPQRPTPITWWVVAANQRGNQARTSNQIVTACQ